MDLSERHGSLFSLVLSVFLCLPFFLCSLFTISTLISLSIDLSNQRDHFCVFCEEFCYSPSTSSVLLLLFPPLIVIIIISSSTNRNMYHTVEQLSCFTSVSQGGVASQQITVTVVKKTLLCVLQLNILVDTGSSNFAVAAAPHPFITHYFNTAL